MQNYFASDLSRGEAKPTMKPNGTGRERARRMLLPLNVSRDSLTHRVEGVTINLLLKKSRKLR